MVHGSIRLALVQSLGSFGSRATKRLIGCGSAGFKTLTGIFSNEDDYPDAALDPEESLNADQRRALVNASVDALDLAQAALVLAIYRERLTYSQLAARAGLPVTTVKIKVRRALLRMRTQLEDRTQTPSPFLT